jgi:D-lactate dehydrogenase (cytochrome)
MTTAHDRERGYDCSFVADLLPEEQVSFGDSAAGNHAGDWGTAEDEEVRPDVVVFPESTADVSAVVAAAADRGVPVTPYAAGTGLSGGATPAQRGISLDTTRMDRVLEVRPGDLQVDVQPGLIGEELNEQLAADGLTLPSLPTSGDISTVGGMLSTDASGMNTVRYGKVGDWALELEVVLADGSVVEVGSKAVKSSSGYNLKDLFIGSEGTLGVITRATMQLAGIPEQTRAGRAVFGSLDDATAAVHDAVQSGVDLAAVELLDDTTAKVANAYSDTDLPDKPLVFFEFHANHGIEEEVDFFQAVLESHGVERVEVAEEEAEMADLWAARHDLAYAVEEYDPDRVPVGPEDIVVPISAYPEIIRFAKEAAREAGLDSFWFGHAGDGNVHGGILTPEDDPEAMARAHEVTDRIFERTVELGGTITGEHGTGQHEKRAHMSREHGPVGLALMRAVKQAIDPQGIINPGKVIPEDAPDGQGPFG